MPLRHAYNRKNNEGQHLRPQRNTGKKIVAKTMMPSKSRLYISKLKLVGKGIELQARAQNQINHIQHFTTRACKLCIWVCEFGTVVVKIVRVVCNFILFLFY